jgi:hypothetical protein
MNSRLVIDYKECELSREEIIALSYGVNRLTDIQSRQGYYSNTFRLPKTATNLDIFGYPDQLNSTDTKRYERLTAFIESDGVQVVYGFAQLQSVADFLEVVVKGGNADWIGLMQDRRSEDLNLRTLDHQHTQSVIQSNRFNSYTSGLIYPDIDYGWLKDETENARGKYFYPALFMHRYIQQAFEDIGYTLDNSLDQEDRYQKMVLPFSNKEVVHSDEWEQDKLFSVRFGYTAVVPLVFTTIDILPIIAPYYDNGGHVDTVANSYNAGDNILNQTFRISITYSVGALIGNPTADSLTISFKSTNTVSGLGQPTTIITTVPPIVGTFTIESEFEWHDDGEDLEITCRTAANATLEILDGELTVLTVDKSFAVGSQWNLAVNLPDLLNTDVVKYIANAFNVIISTNTTNNVVTITPFNDVAENLPEDWSEKVDLSEEPMLSFDYGDFKQSNDLKYTINTDDTYLKDLKDLGEATITNSKKPDGRVTLYQAPFSFCNRAITLSNTITKGVIDLHQIDSNYTYIVCRTELFITNITIDGVVTVSSGAMSLRVGMGIYLYDLSDLLFEGPLFFPDLDGWANERVFIVASITSDTQFQMEGDFHYQAVSTGKLRAGVMVDKFDKTYVNVYNLNGATVNDSIIFYNTPGATLINGNPFTPTNGAEVLIDELIGSRCVRIKEKPTYTISTEYLYPTVLNDFAITSGDLRIIKQFESKDAKPRIAMVTVSTDADNAITLYGETTETQVSELYYDDITWESLVSAYWNTLSAIIESPQMVKTIIRLSSLDIYSLDFTRPKYLSQFGCLFYLSYVDQFKTNQVDSTEVELVRLP